MIERGFVRTARITSLFNVHCSIVWDSRRGKDVIKGRCTIDIEFLSRVYDEFCLLCLGVCMGARKGRGNRSVSVEEGMEGRIEGESDV